MRKIVCQSFVSLDGVINHMERWHFAYSDAESDATALEQLRDSDALLMGRGTYEVYASAWPNRQGLPGPHQSSAEVRRVDHAR